MKMRMKLVIRVRPSRPDEYEEAERLQAKADEVCHSRGATLDESLCADFVRLIGDLNQLFDRAGARRRRRRKGDDHA